MQKQSGAPVRSTVREGVDAVRTGPAGRARETSARGARRDASGRVHVCFVAPAAWPVLSGTDEVEFVGGAEVQQCTLARAFVRRGYRVSMICLDHGQAEGVVVDGVRCLKAYRPGDGVPVLRFLHPRLTSLWRAMARADADVYYVRSTSMLAGLVAAFCRRHGRRSVYAGASDVDFLPGRQRIRYARDRWLYEYGLRHVDAVVVQNEHQRETCLANYGRSPVRIPSCYVPPPGASADRRGGVLWVANLRELKRPHLCLELARRLPHRRFTMIGGPAGDGAAQQAYFRRIEREAATLPNVEFLGFVPPAAAESHFDRARVFLNTSEYEGFPNTFLQCWSRGVPTVAFVDTGSRDDAGQPVYKVARDVADAANEIERLMSDDVYWKQASERCRSHFAAHHAVEAVVREYDRLFAGLMEGHARKS